MNGYRRAAIYLLALTCLAPLALASGGIGPITTVVGAQEAQAGRVWITPRGGRPFFVIGANYEGATDRAWAMWENDKFDAALIDQDFARARSVGINTLRIFVQRPLRTDINAGNFSKLDTVTSLARKHNLWLIVTFTDWAEPDVTAAGALNARIAAHLASEPSILAYDVKNEPQFADIVGAIYPSSVPMQSPELVALYGDRVPRSEVARFRQGEGRSIIPARMNEDQAYAVANYYKLYLEFLDAASVWAGSHPGQGTLDYIDSPDSASWSPYLAGLDATLGAWVSAQIAPVRQADPGRPATVGYSNAVLAKLPSNRALDFQSIHRFTSHGYSGLNGTFKVLDNLQRTYPTHPVLLEEFGYPGQVRSSNGSITGYDPRTTANLESAVWLYLYSKGLAGGAKWMLNNFSGGHDPAQNSFGLFDNGGQPKLSAYALRQITSLINNSSQGVLSSIRSDENYAVSYAYTAPNTTIAGGKVYTGTHVTYTASGPAQLIMGRSRADVTLFSTDVATVTVNLPGIYGVAMSELGRVNLTATNSQGQPWTPSQPTIAGGWARFTMSPLYTYRLTAVPRAIERAQPHLDPNTVYFPQTGHNLGGEFLRYWQTRGGLPIFGYPLTEPFNEGGYIVQYFERNRFELHPENQPPYNVLLGRLGASSVAGRAFPTVAPFQSGPDRLYFPETRHSLSYGFLGYWQRYGGLAQFGYPISEEIRERSATDGREYTVQYFERARFEYHPEYRGTDAEVLLGLLGVTTMKEKGWLP
jgi:hypothetical protein